MQNPLKIISGGFFYMSIRNVECWVRRGKIRWILVDRLQPILVRRGVVNQLEITHPTSYRLATRKKADIHIFI